MTTSTIAIIGNGQAGVQTAASLREGGYDGGIVLIGDEPGLPYQRPPLSKAFLASEVAESSLLLRREEFYGTHRIEMITDTRATSIERSARRVHAGGRSIPYDHLVLATGARDRPLRLPGAELDGVMGLRTRADAIRLRARLAVAQTIVVIGAGFIGLEFAATAVKQRKRVHIVEIAQRAMARAVSPEVSAFFHAAHASSGIGILFSAAVTRITGEGGHVVAVETADGLRLPADLVVAGIGVQPNTELAGDAGLEIANGIVVDEYLRTSDPLISAIGDCAAYPNPFAGGQLRRLESVQNASDHARCVAARLLGHPAPYHAVPWFWSDQGSLRLQMAGLTESHDTTVLRGSKAGGSFSVFAFKSGQLVGIESINRVADHMVGRRLLGRPPILHPDQAADEGFDLKALVTAQPTGSHERRGA